MLRFIYIRPLWQVAAVMLAAPILWAALRRVICARSRKAWLGLSTLLLSLALAGIFAATLVGRAGSGSELVLRPLAGLGENPEKMRTLFMNGLLFEPLGLALPELLPSSMSRGKRFFLAVLAAFLLSLCLEAAQYYWCLGRAETDDVLMNALGAGLGGLGLFPGRK